jgi:hypothetical protein
MGTSSAITASPQTLPPPAILPAAPVRPTSPVRLLRCIDPITLNPPPLPRASLPSAAPLPFHDPGPSTPFLAYRPPPPPSRSASGRRPRRRPLRRWLWQRRGSKRGSDGWTRTPCKVGVTLRVPAWASCKPRGTLRVSASLVGRGGSRKGGPGCWLRRVGGGQGRGGQRAEVRVLLCRCRAPQAAQDQGGAHGVRAGGQGGQRVWRQVGDQEEEDGWV